tara:strand:- start:5430 stop:6113 length:684 start_codon:yes stop_codon:yes gene_type:complete
MAYRWNRRSVENKTVTNGRELDISINDFIDVMNNGIDRENLPEAGVDKAMIFDQNIAVYAEDKSCAINEGFCGQDKIYNASASSNPRGNEIFGLRYTDSVNLRQGGSWIRASNAALDALQVFEGMLTIDWRCKSFIPKYYTFYNGTSDYVAPKFVQWQIRYNGNVVYESGPQFTQWNNVYCTATIPVATGTSNISIHYRIPELISDSADSVVFYFFGGQITTMNRRK